ncbi:MAG: PKD domain-containing protein, partial [Nanoarchaeota archaeon]
TFFLEKEDSEIIGIKLEGKILNINSIEFEIESNVLPSCYNQLAIDLFNNKEIDIVNNKSFEFPECDDFLKRDNCFDENKETENYIIQQSPPYCQKIELTESPGFKLGAWVKEKEQGNAKITMGLYDSSGNSLRHCELPKEEITEEGREVYCSVNYSVIESKDYYVCIYSDEGTGEYLIQGNVNPTKGCGFYGLPVQKETTAAYKIFAEGKKFRAIETMKIHNSISPEKTLAGEISQYLTKNYEIQGGYTDCSLGCVIPLKIISEKDQEIILKNLNIFYEKSTGKTENHQFYDISKSPAKVTADFQKLYLNKANFSVPDEIGDYEFELHLGEQEILSQEILIQDVPIIKSLSPKITASAYPTEFIVEVESANDINQYNWNFGDEETETTSTNKVIHIYKQTGTYQLTIKVIDNLQRESTGTFSIQVGSPKIIINNLLSEMLNNLNNVKPQIKNFPSFYQNIITAFFDIDSAEKQLEDIQKENMSATTESEYNLILTKLLGVNLPESISISRSANSISFYNQRANVDLDVLEEISEESYDRDNKEEYVDAILSWNQQFLNTKMDFKEISATYDEIEEPVLRAFDIEITKNTDKNAYLIIKKLEDLNFKEDYGQEEKSGYNIIPLTQEKQTISFITTEEIEFSELPVFISPKISELSISGIQTEKDAQLAKVLLFILILIFLLIVGVVVYIILQEWYKKKYEAYLFKNKNDLYNLISYVQSSKKKGLKEREISDKLKKAGWKSEQVNYILKKYSGKRVGMFEIPIGKILEKLKNKDKKSMKPGKEMQNQNFQKK